MRFRKLRIAWSVFWGLACVLLVALWVRSYWWGDVLQLRPSALESFGIGSAHGVIGADGNVNPLRFLRCSHWRLWSYPMYPEMKPPLFHYERGPLSGFEIDVPHWFLAILFGTVATVPWIGKRFSVRTLLIATTVVAGFVGLVVYLAGK